MDGEDKVNILLVDDQPAKLLTYEAVLKELGENLLVANSARQAFDHLLRADVAVVLMDVYMPDLDGFELARMIREHPRFQQTAIIFISAVLLTDLDFLRGYQVGAVDYVPVPVVPEILRAKVKIFAELYRKSRQLERLNRELEQRVAERTAALEASTAELRQKEERLQLVFDAAHMGWCDCDLDTGQVWWSSRLAQMIGLPADSDGGSFAEFLNHVVPEDRGKFLALVQGGPDSTGSQGGELRFSRPDGSIRWSFAAGQLIRQENPRPVRFTGVFLDVTERKKAEEQQTLLMREVDHRAKNLLAVVQSMLNLSKAETTAEFITAVSGRIKALSLAHTLLSESRWQGVELERLVEEETAPFEGQKVPRIRFEGPPVSLQPAAAQCLAVTLHELITNAAKYGALSSSTGLVTLEWELRAEGLVLHWVERGGPPVSPPARRGFGTQAMTASIEQQLGGRLNLDWRPDGLRLQLSIPKESFLALDRPQAASRPAQPGAGALPSTLAAGSRILLVEDEALIGAMFKQLLSDLGFEVVGPIASLDQAVAAAHGEDVQGAILDVNLGGTPIYPVADALEARGIPFVFVTGYSASSIDRRYAGIPVFEKPVQPDKLSELLANWRLGAADTTPPAAVAV
jgi:PAS domain S-box-containing protein